VKSHKVKSIIASVKNELHAFNDYLNHRLRVPLEVRLEAIWSFSDLTELEDISWPYDPSQTHGLVLNTLLAEGCFSLKEDFTTHMSHYIRYLISNKNTISSNINIRSKCYKTLSKGRPGLRATVVHIYYLLVKLLIKSLYFRLEIKF